MNLYSINKINLGSIGYLKIPLYYDRFKNSLFAYDDTNYTRMKKKSSWKSSYDDYSAGGAVELGTSVLTLLDIHGIVSDSLKIGGQFKGDHHKETNTTNDTAMDTTKQVFVDKPEIRFKDHTVSASIEYALTLWSGLTLVPSASFSRRTADKAENLNDSSKGMVYKYIVASFPLTTEKGFSLQLASYYKFNTTNMINASLSKRSRFPSIKDRYSYRLGSAIPNPDLKPEYALQGEVGYVGSPINNFHFQLSGFGVNIDSVIQLVSNAGGPNVGQNQNKGKARFYGYEIGANYLVPINRPAFDHIGLSFNQSYIHRRNISNPTVLFTDVPEYKDVLSFEYAPVKQVNLLWSTEWNSQRYSSSDGKRIAGAYSIENIRLQATMHGVTLNAGINNMLDVNYCISEGYPEEGRTFFANLSYDLKR
jgi:iron complex outermembrane receptor protein